MYRVGKVPHCGTVKKISSQTTLGVAGFLTKTTNTVSLWKTLDTYVHESY